MKGNKGRICTPVPGVPKHFKGQLAHSFFPPAKRKPICSQSTAYSGAPCAGRLGRAAQVPAAPGLLSAARNLKSAAQEVQFLPSQSWWQWNRKAKIIRLLEVYFPFLCIWKKKTNFDWRGAFYFLTGFMSQLKAVRTSIWCQWTISNIWIF